MIRYGRKWVWQVWSRDPKSDCISKMDREYTDFLLVDTNTRKLKADRKSFGWVLSKIGVASLALTVSKE